MGTSTRRAWSTAALATASAAGQAAARPLDAASHARASARRLEVRRTVQRHLVRAGARYCGSDSGRRASLGLKLRVGGATRLVRTRVHLSREHTTTPPGWLLEHRLPREPTTACSGAATDVRESECMQGKWLPRACIVWSRLSNSALERSGSWGSHTQPQQACSPAGCLSAAHVIGVIWYCGSHPGKLSDIRKRSR